MVAATAIAFIWRARRARTRSERRARRRQPFLSRQRTLGRRRRHARRASFAQSRNLANGRPMLRRGQGSDPVCSTRSSATAPNSCAFRSAKPASTRNRRSTIPATATTCLTPSPLTRPAGQRHRLYAVGAHRTPGTEHPPTATTRRAWRESRRRLGSDRGILLEIFNEPPSATARTPAEWKPWQETMQSLIDLLRKAGSQNVLLVGGAQYSRSFEDAPLLHDPLGQIGYAVHPLSRPIQPDPRATGRGSSATLRAPIR